MAKYILKNTSIFVGSDYYPEGSILNISERQAERINNSIYAGYLEILPDEKKVSKKIKKSPAQIPEMEIPTMEIPGIEFPEIESNSFEEDETEEEAEENEETQ